MPNLFANTSHEVLFFVFSLLNVKNLAFNTPAANAFIFISLCNAKSGKTIGELKKKKKKNHQSRTK